MSAVSRFAPSPAEGLRQIAASLGCAGLAVALVAALLPAAPAAAQRFAFGGFRIERVLEEGVLCLGRNALQTTIGWDEVERVLAVTVTKGPGGEDLFWVVESAKADCRLGHRADPDLTALEAIAAKLPGFRWAEVIRALQTHGDREFVAWQRQARPQ